MICHELNWFNFFWRFEEHNTCRVPLIYCTFCLPDFLGFNIQWIKTGYRDKQSEKNVRGLLILSYIYFIYFIYSINSIFMVNLVKRTAASLTTHRHLAWAFWNRWMQNVCKLTRLFKILSVVELTDTFTDFRMKQKPRAELMEI